MEKLKESLNLVLSLGNLFYFYYLYLAYYKISARTQCSLNISNCSRHERYFLSTSSSDWLETVLLQIAPVTFKPVLP